MSLMAGVQPTLTTRVGASDVLFLRGLFGQLGGPPAAHLPGRLVVDAHVPLSADGAQVAQVARNAGVPFLVDPETMFLQDHQHSGAPWLRVPYAEAQPLTHSDFWDVSRTRSLVADVVEHQLSSGATAVIAPYLHLERADAGWDRAQAALWRHTRWYLNSRSIHLPLVAVVAIGWRCLSQQQRTQGLARIWDALDELAPDEVALAASKAHGGVRPYGRTVDLLAMVQHLSMRYRVTLWQQGVWERPLPSRAELATSAASAGGKSAT